MATLDPKTAREMLQARLLAAIFAKEVKRELALKGGMAMRAAYGSARFTKDIDLAADPDMSPERVRARIRAAIKTALATGLLEGAAFSEPKQTDTTQRWKISGSVGRSKVNLTVEVSRRDQIEEGQVARATYVPPKGYGAGPMTLDVFDLKAIAANKVACLVNPKREAPRDVYDLDMLIRLDVRPPIEVLRRMGKRGLEEALDDMWSKLEKLDFKAAEAELLTALPESAAAGIDAATWDDMRTRVGTTMESWLKEALDGLPAETVPPGGSP